MPESIVEMIEARDQARDALASAKAITGPSAHLHRDDAQRDFDRADGKLRRFLEKEQGDDKPSWALWDIIRSRLCAILNDGFPERSMLPALDRVERLIAALRLQAGVKSEDPASKLIVTYIADLFVRVRNENPQLAADVLEAIADPAHIHGTSAYVLAVDDLLKFDRERLSALTDIAVSQADGKAEAARRRVLAYMSGIPNADAFRGVFVQSLKDAAAEHTEFQPLVLKADAFVADVHDRIVRAASKTAMGLTA